jgi:hypothetical protein
MNTSDSLSALRRANPRSNPRFSESIVRVADTVRAHVALEEHTPVSDRATARKPHRLLGISAASASLAAVVSVAAFIAAGSLTGGPGFESAAAAVEKAATLTAASAERSGTAVVRMTHNGEPWAGKTVRWNGRDLAVSRDEPKGSRKAGSEMLLVGGVLYGVDPGVAGGWVNLGSPKNIDPGSGTTPDDLLVAVGEDVGGKTLRRITTHMNRLTTLDLEDGSTVYSGTVPAGQIARERGFKGGESIRVFPFGYVAHDEAANPVAALDVSVTVGPDGIVREIAVTWGATASAWTYDVTYSRLGSTPAPIPPANAPSILELRGIK